MTIRPTLLRFALIAGLAWLVLAPDARAILETNDRNSFTPDLVLDFSDLVPGTKLQPGTVVAPGITFGGVFGVGFEAALVVDLGAGERALETFDLGPDLALPFVRHSVISFTFASDVEAVGGDMTLVATTSSASPTYTAYDASDATLTTYGIIPIGVGETVFMGARDSAAQPIRIVQFASSCQSCDLYRVDDVAIRYVPEPPAGAAAAVALLALAAASARRRPKSL